MKKSFCEKLRTLRGDRSQADIAGLLGIKQQAYAKYENGVTLPGFETIQQLCFKLNVSADWLLGITDAPSVPAIVHEVKQASEPDTYWRDLAVSQQDTITKLTAMLAEGRAPVAAPVRVGGRTATKTA